MSIITPAFNAEPYIRETIESVLGQTYEHIEYIVLDDGSTDNTHRIAEQYSPRIRLVRHENMGEARTVNRGYGLAHGDIISVINADDTYAPEVVEKVVQFLENRKDVLVAYFDWATIDSKSNVIDTVRVPEFNYLHMVRRHHCITPAWAFMRKEALSVADGRDPQFKYVGDFDYWLRLGLHCVFARVPSKAPLAFFRVHPDSASVSKRGAVMASEHIRLMQKFYSRPDLPPEVRKVHAEAYSWAYSEAAVTCATERWRAGQYLLKSALYHPQGYLLDPDRVVALSQLVLPKPLYSLLIKVWRITRPILAKGRWLIRRILI